MSEIKQIVIMSDGTGRTARRLMDAVLIQYEERDIEYSLIDTYQNVRSRKDVDAALKKIHDDDLVLFSIIARDLSDYLTAELEKRQIMNLNVLQPMLDITSKFLGVHPDYLPGKLQIVNDNYYKKVDAIGFAVHHDDGLGLQLEEAEVVLLGISRTCKTPICMYLACNFGIKAANIPIIRNSVLTTQLLARLARIEPGRIVGLLMQPEVLAHIRQNRSDIVESEQAGGPELFEYYDVRAVAREYRFSAQLFESQNWLTIDVTRRAIEEISIEIMQTVGLPR